jgi:ATP-dependent DNA ligase
MKFPLPIDYAAMEAHTADEIPRGDDWQYEPKWDGFRCLVFRDGDEITLMSKSGQPLARYFPEVVESLRALKMTRFVMDGELIINIKRTLDFDALLQRIHPAESRIKKLSNETPATLMVFDLLVGERSKDLTTFPLRDRRRALEKFAGKYLAHSDRIRLSPMTSDFGVARSWFKRMAGPLDGVIAKRIDRPYASGERGDAMLKIKNLRTADCVVGGFRYATKNKQVASLLLGLYDDAGLLHHVGFTSGIAAVDKPQLTKKLEALIQPPGFTGAAPGGPSRWSTGRSADWQPLKPTLVVEVQYDHFTGHRFRHGTKLLRWRPEKKPASCRLDQVRKESESPLTLLD